MNNPLATLTAQFIQERRFLKNVSEKTMIWYRVAFANFASSFPPNEEPSLPTKAAFQRFVVGLRERGLKPVSCNTYISALNTFALWLHQEGHVPERVKMSKLRVEKRVLELLTEQQLKALVNWKPRTFRESRLHLNVRLVMDTGLRISEALNLRHVDIDFDNLILKVIGKGQKERLVPFSPELRKRIYRFGQLKANK